jgi:hypothetical protein
VQDGSVARSDCNVCQVRVILRSDSMSQRVPACSGHRAANVQRRIHGNYTGDSRKGDPNCADDNSPAQEPSKIRHVRLT